MDMLKRKDGENLIDYKERIYKNRSRYNLSWEDVGEILEKGQNADHIRKTSYGYLEAVKDMKNVKFDNTVMIINDIHLPFEREDVLDIISKHSDEITTLVIAGDLMDCESISSFPNIKRMTLKDEIVYAYNFMKKVRKILDKNQEIIIFNGNHEERLHKTISKLHEKDLQQFINPNVIDMLVDGFTLYEDNKKVKYEPIKGISYIPHWYIVLDEIVACHPKDFSRVKGKMLENVTSHFINKGIDFEVVVFGHTHKASSGIVDRYNSKFAIENPCLCKPHDYADCGKLGYSPQAYGYTIIKYNEEQKIDINNIKTYYIKEISNNDTYKIKLD